MSGYNPPQPKKKDPRSVNPSNIDWKNPGSALKEGGLPTSTGDVFGRGSKNKNNNEGNISSPKLGDITPVQRALSEYKFNPLSANEQDANYFNDQSGEMKRNAELEGATNRRFDVLRAKTEGAANEQQQMQTDALTRQAAARGRLGSGNFQKQNQQLQKGLSTQKENAVGDVESQRELAVAQQHEASAQRAYQSEEAAKQRAFTADQAKIQRGFDRDVFNKESEFKATAFNEQNAQFMDQMGIKVQEMQMDKDISQFNMDMAAKTFNKKDMSEWFANLWGYDPRSGKWGNSSLS